MVIVYSCKCDLIYRSNYNIIFLNNVMYEFLVGLKMKLENLVCLKLDILYVPLVILFERYNG